MINFSRQIFIFSLIFLFSCQQSINNKSELELREKELELKEKELKLKEVETELKERESKLEEVNQSSKSNSKKFCCVVVRTTEKDITVGLSESGSYTKETMNNYIYSSNIIEVENFNEENEYKLIDEYERQIKQSLKTKYLLNNENESNYKIKSTICKAFDSYKIASDYKRNLK